MNNFLAGVTPADTEAEREDGDDDREASVFWVSVAARREAIRSAAKQTDIGKRFDDGLSLMEAENPKRKGATSSACAQLAGCSGCIVGGPHNGAMSWTPERFACLLPSVAAVLLPAPWPVPRPPVQRWVRPWLPA